jgi:hypothetical protein
MQTFGPNIHWIRVTVDPMSREVFAFHPIIVEANRSASPALVLLISHRHRRRSLNPRNGDGDRRPRPTRRATLPELVRVHGHGFRVDRALDRRRPGSAAGRDSERPHSPAMATKRRWTLASARAPTPTSGIALEDDGGGGVADT